jgi:DNA-binding SARP family transcriptional activator
VRMEFRILGPLEVEDDGRSLKVSGAKQRALLALLLLHANEAVPRERLIDELWGEEPPETAATAIQVHISQLRKTLGRDVIVTQSPGYLLRVADGELDLDRFDAAVSRARNEPPAEAADALREALTLWRGPPLAEVDAPFARAERARLEEHRLAALEQRIDADLELGRHPQLVPELEGLVRSNPLRERLRGQLMLALYRCGRQADALAVYQSGRKLLDEELGLEPGEDLRRLERQILEQDESLSAPAGKAPAAWAPAGTATFLFTDIEGAARLDPAVLAQHDGLVRETLGRYGGETIDAEADAFFYAFRRARDAVGGAVELQRTVAQARWPDGTAVRLRVGIHTGETGYHGLDVVRAARISGVAAGGQTLVSSATRDLVADAVDGAVFEDLGDIELRDLQRPEHVFQVTAPGLQAEFPPLGTAGIARVMAVGGREQELADAAGAALTTEERRVRLFRRSWVIAVAGALVLLAALVAIVLAVTGGTSDVSVAPNSVVAIDEGSGKPVADVGIGGRPIAITAGPEGVWAANADRGTVSEIDPKGHGLLQTIGLGADVNAIAQGFGSVWVAGGNDETVFRIDPRQGVEAKLQFGRADPLRPEPVFFIATGRDGVWITRGRRLLEIDPATNRLRHQLALPGNPIDLAAGDGDVWVPLEDERLVHVDEGSGQITGKTQLPAAAFSPVVTPGALWLILATDTQQVVEFDPDTATERGSVSFPNGFVSSIAAGSGSIWATDHARGRIWRVDKGASRLVTSVAYHPISVAAADGTVWVGVQEQPFR